MATTDHNPVQDRVETTARVETAIQDSIAVRERLLDEMSVAAVVSAAEMVTRSLARGGKLLLFGNGGSASDASHIAAEFVGRFQRERRAFPAISLAANQSSLTAIGNDYGFEHVFARQVEAFAAPGDVAIAISTSGRSANVLAAVRCAQRLGLGTIGLTGETGGELGALVDICLRIPASSTARVQEGHILLAHVLCELVERELA
ncbi:MAG TPA: D-sedoheptulose 7-phosphate isomerase [Solirubrobacteraceae bacterium]|nr:D-sedoheptulose 7-phosphate isomerase [Solirubrobacteraceae bacterium]